MMEVMFALAVGPGGSGEKGRKPRPTCWWCLVVLVIALCLGALLCLAIFAGEHRP